MNIEDNPLKNKKILITGHTGFKGSWLSIWLDLLGAEVIGYALEPNTNKDNFILSNVSQYIHHYTGEVRDQEELLKVFQKEEPEIVFHLAAQSLVRESYKNPAYTYDVNVMGTLNVLECIRNTETAKLGIIITTDKCYHNNEWIYGYRENDELGGRDMYSSSKACAELLVKSFNNSFLENTDKKVVTVRAGNVIGGGDWAQDRIIPDCIRCLEKNQEIVIRSPNAIRPWQHVLEPLWGYITLAKRYLLGQEIAGAWNFGPEINSCITVENLVKKIIQFWGNGMYYCEEKDKFSNFHEATFLKLDSTKSKSLLNWKPIWGIDQTILKAIEWYKEYEKRDVYKLCVKQIQEYMKTEKLS